MAKKKSISAQIHKKFVTLHPDFLNNIKSNSINYFKKNYY